MATALIPADTTVVTALYPMKSKMSIAKYLALVTRWWPQLPQCRLVFFVPPDLEESILAALAARPAGHTLVIPLPFEKLAAAGGKLDRGIWRYTADLDPEKGIHSPELYAIWYEKKEFVLRAAALNPFQSEYFVWCDAGIGRRGEWLPLIQGFPAASRIPRGKMLCLEVEPMRPEDFEGWVGGAAAALGPDFSARQATIGGGILASDLAGWKRWSRAYDAMLLRYHMAGRFIGKDQNIIAGLVASDPSLAVVIPAPQEMGGFDKWFYLLFFLAGLSISST